MNASATSTVLILKAHCPEATARAWVSRHEHGLPAPARERIKRYVRDHDKALSMMGRMLLIEGLNRLGIATRNDLTVWYPPGKRPVLPTLPHIRFSIAHSGEWIVCALSQNVEVGIDLEQRTNRNPLTLSRFLTPAEWDAVENATNPTDLFYAFWTRKEAIIKAADCLAIDAFPTLDTGGPPPRFNGKRWHLAPVAIHPDYVCSIATDVVPIAQTVQLSF